jgi:hypothetical protein
MRLPRRKSEFDQNPWDDEVGLSGWVPGTSERLDMFAMMASLAHAQWTLAQWLVAVGRVQNRLAFSLMICSLLWVFVAVANLNNVFHWW